MKAEVVGKIKNIMYDPETNNLEVSIIIIDNKFKKKLLRDLSLSGNIEFKEDKIYYKNEK
jgi:sporulation protein YlmC with PRC-barrel domain